MAKVTIKKDLVASTVRFRNGLTEVASEVKAMAKPRRFRSVYLLQHAAREGRDDEEVKTLGIFSSEKEAKLAIRRFKKLPGFSRYPNNFHLNLYRLNEREWPEGFF